MILTKTYQLFFSYIQQEGDMLLTPYSRINTQLINNLQFLFDNLPSNHVHLHVTYTVWIKCLVSYFFNCTKAVNKGVALILISLK